MKKIIVRFSDGRRFAIPAQWVALDKATYYANKDNGDYCKANESAWLETEKKEFNLCYEDEGELLDWANNNTDWGYLSEFAEALPDNPVEADYQKEWANAGKEVVG